MKVISCEDNDLLFQFDNINEKGIPAADRVANLPNQSRYIDTINVNKQPY